MSDLNVIVLSPAEKPFKIDASFDDAMPRIGKTPPPKRLNNNS